MTATINISVNVKKPTQSVRSTRGGRLMKGSGRTTGTNKPIAPITANRATENTSRKKPTFSSQDMRLTHAFQGALNKRATMIAAAGKIGRQKYTRLASERLKKEHGTQE